jgi:hypothetical protein
MSASSSQSNTTNTGAHDEEAKTSNARSEQATQSLYTKIIMRKAVNMQDG